MVHLGDAEDAGSRLRHVPLHVQVQELAQSKKGMADEGDSASLECCAEEGNSNFLLSNLYCKPFKGHPCPLANCAFVIVKRCQMHHEPRIHFDQTSESDLQEWYIIRTEQSACVNEIQPDRVVGYTSRISWPDTPPAHLHPVSPMEFPARSDHPARHAAVQPVASHRPPAKAGRPVGDTCPSILSEGRYR